VVDDDDDAPAGLSNSPSAGARPNSTDSGSDILKVCSISGWSKEYKAEGKLTTSSTSQHPRT
jgi:hypothetical protein